MKLHTNFAGAITFGVLIGAGISIALGASAPAKDAPPYTIDTSVGSYGLVLTATDHQTNQLYVYHSKLVKDSHDLRLQAIYDITGIGQEKLSGQFFPEQKPEEDNKQE